MTIILNDFVEGIIPYKIANEFFGDFFVAFIYSL